MEKRGRTKQEWNGLPDVLDETARNLFQQAETLRRQAQDLVTESQRLRKAAERIRNGERNHKELEHRKSRGSGIATKRNSRTPPSLRQSLRQRMS